MNNNDEITDKTLSFEELSKRPPKKVKGSIPIGIPVQVGNVTVYFKKDEEETFPESMTLDELLYLDAKKPGIVTSIKPNLYSVFKSSVNKTLEPYVRVGDKVVFGKDIYVPAGRHIDDEYYVESLELCSIGSLSVFAANLTDGVKLVQTNFLKVI